MKKVRKAQAKMKGLNPKLAPSPLSQAQYEIQTYRSGRKAAGLPNKG